MSLETPLDMSPEAVRAALVPIRNDFSVALVSPGNAFAVGAVIRIAHSFLAREVFVVGGGSWYAKASMGMEKYETIRRFADVTQLIHTLHDRPLWAIEKDHARRSIRSVRAFPRGVVFAFGSERFGLPAELLRSSQEVVGIPIYGVNHSLPVAVAAGIVMHEWACRRYVEGSVA
ncbi:MAG: TrmH family RNA methyltransferase [Polyangiaceae bacterium]|jgi:tRNA G18 (ribose-2'-O)-methylase SpoU